MLSIQRYLSRRLLYIGVSNFSKLIKTPPPEPTSAGTGEIINKRKKVDQETLDYLEKKVQASKNRCIIDKQNHRIDIGLIISREPIFLHIPETEMLALKFRQKYAKKYNLMTPLPKEMLEFQEKEIPLTETRDELYTHEIVHPDGTRTVYRANSKRFLNVDPNIVDPKSIQYASAYRIFLLAKDKRTQNWVFPTAPLRDKQTFAVAKSSLVEQLTNKAWSVVNAMHLPACITSRELTDEEKADDFNKRAIRIKTYYFNVMHGEGVVSVNQEFFDDYTWARRLDLNKYLSKEEYDKFVHSCPLY